MPTALVFIDATAGVSPYVDQASQVAEGGKRGKSLVPIGLAIASSTVVAGAVQLQGSDDARTWTPIGTPTSLVAGQAVQLQGGSTAYRHVRAVFTTPVVGGTATVAVTE